MLFTPDLARMSSVLFNRGINTQTGGSRKAAEAIRELDIMKQQISNFTLQQIDIIELRNQVATLNAKVSVADAKMAALNANVTALEMKVTTSDATVAALEAKVTTSETKIAALETKVTISEAKVAALEAKVITSEAKIAALEAKLETLGKK